MKKTSLYYLYCLNKQCQFSIYQLMVEHKLPLNEKNKSTIHVCSCCGQPLSSYIKPEEKQLSGSVRAELLQIPKYLYN